MFISAKSGCDESYNIKAIVVVLGSACKPNCSVAHSVGAAWGPSPATVGPPGADTPGLHNTREVN